MTLQPKNIQKYFTTGQYQTTVEQVQQSQAKVSVLNMTTLNKYTCKNLKLKNINIKGFQMALNSHKQFSIEFQQVKNQKTQKQAKQQSLKIKVKFNSVFLSSITQQFVLPFQCKLSQLYFFQQKINKMNQKIKQIEQKYSIKQKYAKQVNQKIFKSGYNPDYQQQYGCQYNDSDYDLKQFEQIKVEKRGKYLIQISTLLKCSASYFYFYKDINYQTCFPSGCMMLPTSSHFVPTKLSFAVENNKDGENTFKFYVYDVIDYPFQVRNLVITATKMQ